jgi:hypothetical protein
VTDLDFARIAEEVALRTDTWSQWNYLRNLDDLEVADPDHQRAWVDALLPHLTRDKNLVNVLFLGSFSDARNVEGSVQQHAYDASVQYGPEVMSVVARRLATARPPADLAWTIVTEDLDLPSQAYWSLAANADAPTVRRLMDAVTSGEFGDWDETNTRLVFVTEGLAQNRRGGKTKTGDLARLWQASSGIIGGRALSSVRDRALLAEAVAGADPMTCGPLVRLSRSPREEARGLQYRNNRAALALAPFPESYLDRHAHCSNSEHLVAVAANPATGDATIEFIAGRLKAMLDLDEWTIIDYRQARYLGMTLLGRQTLPDSALPPIVQWVMLAGRGNVSRPTHRGNPITETQARQYPNRFHVLPGDRVVLKASLDPQVARALTRHLRARGSELAPLLAPLLNNLTPVGITAIVATADLANSIVPMLTVKQQVQFARYAGADAVSVFSSSENPSVRAAVCSNKALTDAALYSLASDPDETVQLAASNRLMKSLT